MILKNVKIKNYKNYRNLFWESTDMNATASNLLSPYGTPQARRFGFGSGGVVSLGTTPPPSNVLASPIGNGRLYTSNSLDGSNVFINQSYPYSRLTKYRASVYVRHIQGGISGRPININYADCSQFPSQYPPTITNGNWHYVEHTWTTTDIPKSNLCFYGSQVFFIDTILTGQIMAVWGAVLNVIDPGPDFFVDWPQYGNDKLLEYVNEGIVSQT